MKNYISRSPFETIVYTQNFKYRIGFFITVQAQLYLKKQRDEEIRFT